MLEKNVHGSKNRENILIMKFITIFITIILFGCTAQPVYKSAQGNGKGFKEIALTKNHYRVQFRLDGDRRALAKKYALVRAAELTVAQDYDWFVVENQHFQILNDTNCLSGCSTNATSPDSTEIETVALLDIYMGRGVRPENQSYDAREILRLTIKN